MLALRESEAQDKILAGVSILVVDDDRGLREELCEYLKAHGMRVDGASDVIGARHWLSLKPYDLVLLDLWIGSDNGFDLLRDLRKMRDVPCIMMTAQDDVTDKIVGLELGADDYLFKPVNMRELLARARALLRRASLTAETTSPQKEGNCTNSSGWHFDPARRSLNAPGGQSVPLTTAECDLLTELVANEGKTQSRNELSRRVFNRQWQPFDRSLDGVVVKLRRKLESDPDNPEIIKTVRGRGYVFTGFPAL